MFPGRGAPCATGPEETANLTPRALILGFAAALFIAGAGYINDRILELESFNNGHQLPIFVVGMMFLGIALLNPLLFRVRRALAFRPVEIGVIVILMMAACSIPGRGLLEQYTQVLVMPYHWNRVTPGWQAHDLLKFAPPQALVDEEPADAVVTRFVTGSDKPKNPPPVLSGTWLKLKASQVPWAQWRRPMLTWMPMVLLTAICSVCMALIVHRQWSSHELLRYPIAEFTTTLLERDEEKAFPAVFYNQVFWLGLGIVLLIRVNNGLCVWFPDYLIPVRLSWNFWPLVEVWPTLAKTPWNWGLLNVSFFPLVIAFAFFLSSEISLTLGISQVLWFLVAAPLVTAGISLETDYDIGGWQGWHRAGSYTAFTLMLLYAGRHYYGENFRRAICFWRDRAAADGVVWACRIFLVSVVLLIALVIRLGLSWPLATITVLVMLMTFLIVSRISAETGLFFIQPGWQPFGAIMTLFGGYAMGPTGIVISALVCAVLCIDQSQAFMPYLINGLKISETLKVRVTTMATTTFGMYVIALLIAVPIVLVASYDFGTPTQYHWSYYRVPTMAFRAAEPEILKLKATGTLEQSEALSGWQRLAHIRPPAKFLWAAGSGFVLVIVFAILRLRVPWWPLHPVLFLIWATYPLAAMSHSFLIGWMVKKASVRFGGNRLVEKLKPFMVGVIAGEILGALFFMIVGAVYYFATGEKPLSYRFFPR
ncbi:MAG: hypothetical protein A3K19_13250 [Lentisphaerae bacterium RIFOXYB12_FULL_65_16]|nr:MAG: hypothetical protein A3K19_13250 [Lentisphaerae bacterium RIFOXYB12_FULL_65_16]